MMNPGKKIMKTMTPITAMMKGSAAPAIVSIFRPDSPMHTYKFDTQGRSRLADVPG